MSMTEQEQDDFLSGREELRERQRLEHEADVRDGVQAEPPKHQEPLLACEQPLVDRRTLWQRLKPWLDWR